MILCRSNIVFIQQFFDKTISKLKSLLIDCLAGQFLMNTC